MRPARPVRPIILALAVVAVSLVAAQPAMPVIGFFSSTSAEAVRGQLTAFHSGLKEEGYVEARTSRSNTASRTIDTIGWRRWRPSWLAAR